MTFSRTTTVSDAPAGDSVLQGCLDLDTDLTGAFTGLNALATLLTSKIQLSKKGSPGGVCELDTDTLVPLARIPIIPVSLLPAGKNCPTGTVQWWPSTAIPAGWVECDGRYLGKTTYAVLYAAIGGIYGSNSTKFRVPDLRGYFLRGWNHGRSTGGDPDAATRGKRGDDQTGDKVGTIQPSDVESHTHNLKTAGGKIPVTGGAVYLTNGSTTYEDRIAESGGKESRPANIGFLHIIRT